MGDADEPLNGFSWRSGTQRVTTGIVIWSDIFLHTVKDTGERIAILVIDTQGLFDNKTTTEVNLKMFALGSLLSSVQVLNLSMRIQEDQLQHLHFATDFAQCIGGNQEEFLHEKIFQKLIFLVRDFPNPTEYPFGIDGGSQYINYILNNIQSNQNKELQSVRKHITNTFDQVECCLLPRPGETICEDPNYNGRWSEMSDRFKENLKEIIEYLLMPDNLITKKVNGNEVTGLMLKRYLDTYFQLIQANKIQIRSFAEATIENYMNDLIERCLCKYELKNLKLNDIKNIQEVPNMHIKCKNKVLELFNKERKLGSFEHLRKFRKKLKEKIKVMYREWKENVILMALEEQKKATPGQMASILKNVAAFVAVTGVVLVTLEAPALGVVLANTLANSNLMSSQPAANSQPVITIPDDDDDSD